MIELSIVIAILAILAAMLFPLFATAREKGRLIGCAANLRQLGMAERMYAQDHDERHSRATTLYNPHAVFVRALTPYASQGELFYCPSASGATDSSLVNTPANRATGNISYLYFDYADDSANNAIRPQWLPAAHSLTHTDNPNHWMMTDWFVRNGQSAHRLGNKTINIAFVDGHVKVLLQNPRNAFTEGER